MDTFIRTLQARGMVHDMVPGLAAHLRQGKARAYIGIDPTAASMHVGNLATFTLLRHFQQAGHTPVLLLGGATSMVGDPSFKAQERSLLSEEELRHNQEGIQRQLTHLLGLDSGGEGMLMNNYIWFKEFSFLAFLREVGKHMPIGYMLGKESVKTRVATGLSYTEFAYQLMQGYDFYYLHKHHGVTLQMGGSDQWGNITTGMEFIRKKGGTTQAFGLTTPLLTKADGTKFGKTEQGNLWLDPAMTSPYAFYQFWVNTSDAEAPTLLRRMTLLPLPAIEAMEAEHAQHPHARVLQHALAKEMTCLVHGQEAHAHAVQAAHLLFGNTEGARLEALGEAAFLAVLAQVPHLRCPAHEVRAVPNLLTLLTTATGHAFFPSKREAKEVIQGGGLRINKQRLTDPYQAVPATWLFSKYLLLQKGKKHYYLLERTA